MPVSRRLGQYLFHIMEDAQLEDMIARTMKIIFSTGCLMKKTARKHTVAEVKPINMVLSIFLPSASYSITATKEVSEITKVAAVKIRAELSVEKPKYWEI
jgi:hypothetical protein